ncbi:hypothetical protein [Poseidonocella sp. HB161398]|uniref:preprotein translocase subunit SecA n=1 Tax=Poseidonocella sp. HB161398 TaxID=2320855 RepID=UPI00110886D6|nr:hypothetical protein [Poseidonocella sp. HB161398]
MVPDAAPGFAAPAVRFYPERAERDPGWLDEAGAAVLGRLSAAAARGTMPVRRRWEVARAERISARFAQLSERAFDEEILCQRARIRRQGLCRGSIALGIALAREASHREIGKRQYRVQMRGALAMLSGRLIEMDTGEGKTITAGLAAATAALAGIPVHVITVNGYLAERDAAALAPVYRRLGLGTGVILEGMERPARREAYRAPVTYGSNSEMAFDYLRDRLGFGAAGPNAVESRLRRIVDEPGGDAGPVMRGLHFAIVDEADSVLVDEARTPLILSRMTDPEAEAAWSARALELARALAEGGDYRVIAEERRVELTRQGRARLAEMAGTEGGLWQSAIRREEVVTQALCVLHIFRRGDQYLVRDGKVQIVDEYTGHLQPDRSWSDGLHQLVQAREGVEVTGQNLAIARMTYQRLYRRYVHLCGMTGTAREVAGELRAVYGLQVERVPPRRPSRLRYRRPQIHRSAACRWAAVAQEARRETARGRPVLIGTRSVAASLTVAEALEAAGLPHAVLNAENDYEAAGIIARAGEAGQITVATNMAGRGVDIALPPGSAAAGGLHVILTERHDAGRIDRQLAGRAGRRGERGSVAAILSLEDPLLEVIDAPFLKALARVPLIGAGPRLALFDRAQRRAEKSHARARRDLVRQDRRLSQLLSFAGGLE